MNVRLRPDARAPEPVRVFPTVAPKETQPFGSIATRIPRAPRGREDVTAELSRLLRAHEIVLREARTFARCASVPRAS